ncbi:MAG: hypothetical protein NPINA01_25260 [Nitrospinaceae bacterium]|nr:MAG: hypothetical protein NPINA01_25260 [Nitrospinaceae bacterium]
MVLLLIFSSTSVHADSLDAGSVPQEKNLKPSACLETEKLQKNFRPEIANDLPFPPDAFIEIKKCNDAGGSEITDFPKEQLQREDIEKQKSIQKLSLLLTYIYNQRKNLAGSYLETDQAYDELLKKSLPNLQAYDQTVANYEEALKNYGEYEAYLSALPRAVSDYEKRMGASFQDFVFQKADGAIRLVKTPAAIDPSEPAYESKAKMGESGNLQGTLGEIKAELEAAREKEEKRRLKSCVFGGAVTGVTAAESVLLAALSNPMGALLGASLGATLCSKRLHEKISGWQTKLEDGLVEMGSYVKAGLSKIGSGLYNIGRAYWYNTPSSTGTKIAEHYESTKMWLNKKLGWQ